ncbi:MAG: hypothetical protein VW683_03235 [Betaproteobacteria bacterium]
MSDSTFAQLVSEDIKGTLDQRDQDMLRLPENVQRWRDTLCNIIATVDEQINAINESVASVHNMYPDFESNPVSQTLADKMSKTARFRFHAEKRLAEADRILSMGSLPDPSLSLAAFLKAAIEQHLSDKDDTEMGPDYHDERLRDALLGKWSF